MKKNLLLILCFFSFAITGQRDLTPNKRKDAFGGARDFRNLSNTGLQFQLGPTYMFTKRTTTDTLDPFVDGSRGNYSLDPDGKLGVYGEIGLFHFPKKDNLFSLLVTYVDWGIGFKYFRGSEGIHLEKTDAAGNVVDTVDNIYNFGHGNAYGRVSLNRQFMLVKNWFLVASLGLNFDYRLLENADNYDNNPVNTESSFYKPFYAQMHAGLGFCYRLKRGSYLTIGARSPFIGYQSFTTGQGGSGDKDSRFGNPAFNYYSSKYWPVLFHLKYMFLFEKKQKGCKGADIRDEDAERYRNGQ